MDEDTELVPARRIIQSKKRGNSTTVYQHYEDCCEGLGIQDVVPFLDRMLVLDYIIANEDRHLNNFGALRNAETLEWIGMAPIYDSGSSLGYDKVPAQMRSEQEVVCKPFKNHYTEQIRLVMSFDWIDFDRLSDVKELITGVLSAEGARDYMDEYRIQMIVRSVQRRIDNLKRLARTHKPARPMSIEDDVEEDIAEDYMPKM